MTFWAVAVTVALSACSRPEPMPVLATVPAFTLTAQDGRPFSSATLAGRPYVAAFVFTRCTSICPMLTSQMVNVRRRLVAAGDPVPFIAFSVDPDHDTPEILREYARMRGAGEGFTFLTGDSRVMQEVARHGFLAAVGAVEPREATVDVIHSQHLLLVDARGRLRGYYRTDQAGLASLVADVHRLRSGD